MKQAFKRVLALLLAALLLSAPLTAASAANRSAPARVAGLTVTTANKKKLLKLTWDPQRDADGYQVCRSATGKAGSYQRIATVRGKTAYVDRGLKAATSYFYAVRAFRKVGGRNVFGPYAKANLSTRLTVAALKSLVVDAAQFYVGWLVHAVDANECMDFKDTRPAEAADPDWLEYVRVRSDKYRSVADLKRAAAKYFIKAVYDETIDRTYADFDGKLYRKNYDVGGDAGMDRGTLQVLSLKDTVCRIRVVSYFEDEIYPHEYATDFRLVYRNGRWLFTDMTDSFSIYYQGDGFWL